MGERDDYQYSGKDKGKQRLENHLPEWIRPGPRQTGLNEGLNCVDLA